MKLPNKKIPLLIVATATFVSAVIYINSMGEDQNTIEAPKSNKGEISSYSISLENKYQLNDKDSDGLADWEEMLWGTDINKADTDGDKTKDGEEVALGRDPKIKGPNDQYKEDINYLKEFTVKYGIENENSLTSRVAKELLASANKKEGGEGAKDIAQKISSELKIPDIYKKENLITFSPKDEEKMTEYGTSLISIMSEEIVVAQKNLSNKYVYSDAYKKMGQRLSMIEVPENFLSIHTKYINNYNALSIMERRMVDSEKDPVVLLATLPEYSSLVEEQSVILGQIRAYYNNNGIIFIERK